MALKTGGEHSLKSLYPGDVREDRDVPSHLYVPNCMWHLGSTAAEEVGRGGTGVSTGGGEGEGAAGAAIYSVQPLPQQLLCTVVPAATCSLSDSLAPGDAP